LGCEQGGNGETDAKRGAEPGTGHLRSVEDEPFEDRRRADRSSNLTQVLPRSRPGVDQTSPVGASHRPRDW
jgi:hypothetical protein